MVGGALGQHVLRNGPVTAGAGELRDGVAVPIEFEPFEAVEDGGDGRLVVAFAVGILDAQQEFALAPLGIKPIEQRCPRAADVEVTGG